MNGMLTRNQPKVWLAVFFTALTLVGLLTAADYGQAWDETSEMDILRMNVNQYRAAAGIEKRVPMRFYLDPESGLICDSIERDHGVSAYYPAALIVTSETLDGPARLTLWHAYTWLWFMLGVFALYVSAREMGLSRPLACAGCLILYLSPRFFAEGHYNNKDVLLLALTLCMLATGMRLMKRPTLRRALPFALAGALAANTKIVGLALWGLCALVVLLRQITNRALTRRVACVALATAGLFIALYALLTPALWGDPIGFFRYTLDNTAHFTRWEGQVLFRGAVFTPAQAALPWYYLPVMMALTLPLWTLLAAALGCWAAIRLIAARRMGALRDDESLSLMMALSCFVVPLLYAMITRPLFYNGWRHFYFVFAGLSLTAAYGLSELWRALRGKAARRVAAVALAACMLLTGVQSALNHPNQYVYYNALASVGGVEGRYELDYWNVSVRETLLQWLAKTEGDALTIEGADVWWAQTGLELTYATLPEEQRARVIVRKPREDGHSRFILVNENYRTLYGWTPEADMRLVARVSAYGNALCSVYESEAAP